MSNNHENKRLFGLTNLAVDNGTSVFLITLMILLFGIQSYNNMPKEQYPEASLPTVFINTPYFGNSAEEIENLVTRPIEKELESTNGVKIVSSTSIQDYSVIITEFNAEMDMEQVVRKVKDAVDKAKPNLPDDLTTDPSVLEVNFSDIPIVTVNVSGNYGPDELRKYAEYIEDKIENLKHVNKVDLKGGREREVQIDVDIPKMQSIKVSFTDIENAIASENLTMSGGEIVQKGFRRAVRVIGQFDNVKEIENIIVKSESQRPIYLKNIADVKYSYEEESSIARSDGYPVISLDVIKRRGENLLEAADEINKIVESAKKSLPEDLKISLFNDQSVHTRNEVSNLENSIISGVLLVIMVLLFFLGLRNASFVGMAIPLSMLTGIMWLHVSGTTMNIVVLFSLILALGLLVDNAIVVVENIYRYMQLGSSRKDAAKYGASEVAVPIIASTATTLAAFIPLAVWPGIMGSFMKYMPITLIIVLSSSLFVALVINPVFTSKFMKVDEKIEDKSLIKRKRRNILIGSLLMLLMAVGANFAAIFWLRNLLGFAIAISLINFFILRPAAFYFQNNLLVKLENAYDRFIKFVLKGFMPIIIFAGTFLLLIGSILLMKVKPPAVEFFPSPDPMYINVFVEMPIGTDIGKTNEVVLSIEEKLNKVMKDDMEIVEAILTQIGENTSDPNSPPEPGSTPHKARITVSFLPTKDRGEKSTKDILNKIRTEVVGNAGVKVFVDQNANGPPTGKPLNIEIKGEEIDTLLVLSQKMNDYIAGLGYGGIEELKADISMGKPEMLINIDREAARRYELSTYTIASTFRTAVFGKEVSKLKEGEDEHPIMLRVAEQYRNNINDLINQKITFRNPANGRIVQVPISAVADYEYSSTYSSIKRKDSDRVVNIYSNILDGYNANELITDLRLKMEDFNMPDGYTFKFTGEQEQQAEDMEFLMGAFFFALFMIFIIIVAQFNSLISPFIILLSVLFSTIGVMLGYTLTGMTFSIIFSGVGVISLAGVVVNNAIVLIDYINLLIQKKREKTGVEDMSGLNKEDIRNAIIEGGATRLRPVLLTAITTVLGLVPLAFGINFNFFTLISDLDPQYFSGGDNTAMWGPMAWTIIYGLLFATFLTLIVVPVMYWLAYTAKSGLGKFFKKKETIKTIS